MTIAQDRIAKGQCPNCGKEAAPYRLCYDCRFGLRFTRALKRGVEKGVLKTMGGENRWNKNTLIWKGARFSDPEASKEWGKWQTPINLRETDRRGQPRLRGMHIDVEGTLEGVMRFIGRPCTMDEIMAAWGKLRSKRTDPLPSDLGQIVKAADKRERKLARRAARAGFEVART